MSTAPLTLQDFLYVLPEDRIAKYPLTQRDASRLLHYNGEAISHHTFTDLQALLPPNSHLWFNNTKVIPARLPFRRSTGGAVEVFLLNPVAPSAEIAQAMESPAPVTWHCMVGNLKKWKDGEVLQLHLELNGQPCTLEATLESRQEKLVRLSWAPSHLPFASLVEAAGKIPLPPYLNRPAEEADSVRYQTVYSQHNGAVAAPTAGLHFTTEILQGLQQKGHALHYLTLHVGAGTFQPIKTERIEDHTMHGEQLVVTRQQVMQLQKAQGPCLAVGTTALRTLESLYWYGVLLEENPDAPFFVPKLTPYETRASLPSVQGACRIILNKMNALGVDSLTGVTEIFIFPGYTFRVIKGLITNFHQPGSTLMLLIAALVGNDWRSIYAEALEKDYRFLSYGDSSLLMPTTTST